MGRSWDVPWAVPRGPMGNTWTPGGLPTRHVPRVMGNINNNASNARTREMFSLLSVAVETQSVVLGKSQIDVVEST